MHTQASEFTVYPYGESLQCDAWVDTSTLPQLAGVAQANVDAVGGAALMLRLDLQRPALPGTHTWAHMS
jgi:hypothetical protein